MRVSITSAFGATTCLLLLSSAVHADSGSVRLETRLFVETVSGAGLNYQVTPGADFVSPVPQTLHRRFTVAYRLWDDPLAPDPLPIRGLAAFDFDIRSFVGPFTVLTERSLLTGDVALALNSGGEAYGPPGATPPDSIRRVANADGRTGLHGPYRSLISGMPDTSPMNGIYTADTVTGVSARSESGSAFPTNGAGRWFGLFSFEVMVNVTGHGAAFIGVQPRVPSGQMPQFQYWRGNETTPRTGTAIRDFGGAVTTFPLDIGPDTREPSGDPVQIVADPFNGVDADNLVLVRSSSAYPDEPVRLVIVSDGGLAAEGAMLRIVGNSTTEACLTITWEAPNSAIGRFFNVQYAVTDVLFPQTGTVSVFVVPASGTFSVLAVAAAMVGVRRRR